jgi:hypothetical protein
VHYWRSGNWFGETKMTAQVYNLREIRAKRAIERAYAELEKHMEEIAKIPYRGQGIDGMPYQAKESDPA